MLIGRDSRSEMAHRRKLASLPQLGAISLRFILALTGSSSALSVQLDTMARSHLHLAQYQYIVPRLSKVLAPNGTALFENARLHTWYSACCCLPRADPPIRPACIVRTSYGFLELDTEANLGEPQTLQIHASHLNSQPSEAVPTRRDFQVPVGLFGRRYRCNISLLSPSSEQWCTSPCRLVAYLVVV